MTKNLLIKKATIVDLESKHNLTEVDILIKNGKIEEIKKNIKADVQTFEAKNLHVSQGWIDMRANFCDPGFEYKEDINSGLAAAKKGGFTGVVTTALTQPITDSKSAIEYQLNTAKGDIVDLFPMGSVSEKMEGKNISEMFDMQNAGAVAFSDNKKSIQNASLLKRALLYTKSFNGLIMNYANDLSIAGNGQVNEGISSTENGIPGIPALAEEMMISRDLFLAEYCESRIHISGISTAKSVELIKKAKANGIQVTCDVASHNLLLDDSNISSFDSNFKVLPPLRTKSDIKALIKGIKEGTIDVIVSDHTPQDEESKKCEFNHAKYGTINLESSFGVLNTASKGNDLEKFISAISTNPRKILNLKKNPIEVGTEANLTLFDPSIKWTYSESDIRSKSHNTPFLGTEFTGKALAIFNNGALEKC